MAKTSNLPTKPANTAVVNYQEQLAKEAAEGASKEVAQSEFISFRGGILTLPTGEVESNEMNFIVLDSAYEHAFYGDYADGVGEYWPFIPDAPKSPNCYAFGRVESELAPITEGDGKPDLIVHSDCETCPLNEWKSDFEGGRGKACKNQRRLILLDAGCLATGNPEAIKAAAELYCKLPVTSGQFYSAHVINLNKVVKRPPYAVISKMKVKRHAQRQFEVHWEFVDVIPEAFIPALMEKREKLGDAILFTYPSNAEREQQAAPAAPPKTAGKYAAGQTPAKPQKARQK